MTGEGVVHLFTADVEEYFQVHALEKSVSRADWDVLPSRLEPSVERLLTLLEEHRVRGTFFVLGWVAERHPELVRRIARAGHEIASHGWWHRPLPELSRDEFREDVRSSRSFLEDVTGRRVHGFRAPSFSLVPGQEWVYEVLLEEGYRYDSSVMPARTLGRYGYPEAPTVPFDVERRSGRLLEVPLATREFFGFRVPAAGGAYFRHFPYGLVSGALRAVEEDGRSGVFYVHPWELDPGQPRLPVPWLSRLRHYGGLERVEGRLRRLLDEFRFTSVERHFGLREAGGADDPSPADGPPSEPVAAERIGG